MEWLMIVVMYTSISDMAGMYVVETRFEQKEECMFVAGYLINHTATNGKSHAKCFEVKKYE